MKQSGGNPIKTTLLAGILVCLSFIFAIVLAEITLRFTILDNREYQNEAIAFTMKNLRADNDVGFLWKRNLRNEKDPGWYDQEVFPLITDESGFFNPREAMEKKESNVQIKIIGIGDSFMHGATYEFYDFFKQQGLFYYNMSMSRHCPPQYNIILEKYAIPLAPDWILYGIYENDFDETIDFENWQKSRSDWFAYHSGTWFGAPVQLPLWRAVFAEYAPGLSMLEIRIRRQLGLPPPIYSATPAATISEDEKAEKVFTYIEKAYTRTTQAGISFLCIIIPQRDIDAQGNTGRSYHYNVISSRLKEKGIPTLDLRPFFNNHPDRENLFYKLDAHWNRNGMKEAEKRIFSIMQNSDGAK